MGELTISIPIPSDACHHLVETFDFFLYPYITVILPLQIFGCEQLQNICTS